jgi:hypothetical protein
MPQHFEATYPTIARWVRKYGWIDIGQDEMSRSFIRALDAGGMVWEGQGHYPRGEKGDAQEGGTKAVSQ